MADYQCPHCQGHVTAQPEDTRYALVCPSCNKFFRAEDARASVDAPPVEVETPSVLTASPPDVVTPKTGIAPTRPKRKAGSVTAQAGTIAAVLAMLVMGLVGWALLGGNTSRSSQAGIQQKKAASATDPADNPSAYEPSRADKAAIRTWLKENLGEPEWEEIKWYVSVPIKDIARNEIRLAREHPNDGLRETRLDQAAIWLKGKDYKICQVKLRAKWLLGISSVRLALFRITDGKAEPQGYFDEYYHLVPEQDRGLVTDPRAW